MREARLGALRRTLVESGLDGFVTFTEQDFRYLTGFSGDAGALVIGRDDALLLTDSRYIETAAGEVRGARTVRHGQDLAQEVAAAAEEMGGERWGFDANAVSFDLHRRLHDAGMNLIPTSGIVLALRMIKDREEVAKLRRACAIAADALEEAIDRLRPGMTEREAALWLEVRMRELGAEGPAFPFIVASGPRGSLPHVTAGDRVFVQGDMVTFDVGCRYFGYHSDITRTVALGKPASELQQVYELVRRAQEAGIAAVRPGAQARDVDAAARQVIAEAGYGERFGHGTGHGVGLEIHEWPRISARSEDTLRAGMVLTVEPGIYLPGLGGVRIEDTVVVTGDGAQILTVSPKTLRML